MSEFTSVLPPQCTCDTGTSGQWGCPLHGPQRIMTSADAPVRSAEPQGDEGGPFLDGPGIPHRGCRGLESGGGSMTPSTPSSGPYKVAKFAQTDGVRFGIVRGGERGAWYIPAMNGDEEERVESICERLNAAHAAASTPPGGRTDEVSMVASDDASERPHAHADRPRLPEGG